MENEEELHLVHIAILSLEVNPPTPHPINYLCSFSSSIHDVSHVSFPTRTAKVIRSYTMHLISVRLQPQVQQQKKKRTPRTFLETSILKAAPILCLPAHRFTWAANKKRIIFPPFIFFLFPLVPEHLFETVFHFPPFTLFSLLFFADQN